MITIEHSIPKPSGSGDAFKGEIKRFLGRAGYEVARRMREKIAGNKSMQTSNLLNSIHVEESGDMEITVAAGTNYARMLEEGTGPAAGRARYFPDPVALQPYVKARNRIVYTGKAGSPKRKAQGDEIRDRAERLARFIFVHGTQPHPFAAPTAAEMRPRVIELLTLGAIAGAQAQLGQGGGNA